MILLKITEKILLLALVVSLFAVSVFASVYEWSQRTCGGNSTG